MAKKRGKTEKHARQNQTTAEGQEAAYKKAPHSFVFHRGNVGKNVNQLVMDMRKLMEPYTASNLQVRRKNVLKDFVNVAGVLNVTHFLMYTKTEHVNFKVARLPHGPTLTFRVDDYTLSKDVISSLKRHYMEPKQFLHHPLLVMNNFSGEGLHFKLMATMFQNMFPSINVNKVKLNEIRRCVLLNYNSETKSIDFRHYNVRAVPVGGSRGVKKIIKAKVPDLSRFEDVSEFLTKGGDLSESEAELDGDHNEVTLPQDLASRGNIANAKSAIRLTEIGPRLSLHLLKIEEGLCDGDVLYHDYITKSEEDVKAARAARLKKKQEKAQRKKEQEANLAEKKSKKEEHKKKSLAGMKKDEEEDDVENPGEENTVQQDDKDDQEYYEEEVGEAPDPDLFPSRSSKKRPATATGSLGPNKKRKMHKPGKPEKPAEGKSNKKKELTNLDRIKRRKMRKPLGKQNKNRNKNKAQGKQQEDGKNRQESNRNKNQQDGKSNRKNQGRQQDGKKHGKNLKNQGKHKTAPKKRNR